MKRSVIINTAKINSESLRQLNELRDSFDKASIYFNKIYELKYPEILNDLDVLKKKLDSHKQICNSYIKSLNRIMKSSNEFTSNTIKKTSSIEKVNAHVLISKK